MQRIEINSHKFKLRNEWQDITIKEWIQIKDMEPLDKAIMLMNVNKKNAYLLTEPMLKAIDDLTAHFSEGLEQTTPVTYYRKQLGTYKFPKVAEVNGQEFYLFYETAYAVCQAHDSLIAVTRGEREMLPLFCSHYLREDDDLSEAAIIERAKVIEEMTMDVAIELLYHHAKFTTLINNPKQYPGLHLVNKKSSRDTQMKLAGLGFTNYLNEWAMEKGTNLYITENVYDFFQHLSWLRIVRSQ